jgi:hypothetical protein
MRSSTRDEREKYVQHRQVKHLNYRIEADDGVSIEAISPSVRVQLAPHGLTDYETLEAHAHDPRGATPRARIGTRQVSWRVRVMLRAARCPQCCATAARHFLTNAFKARIESAGRLYLLDVMR